MAHRLGVDVGGTFTDLAMIDQRTGQIRVFKFPTDPTDPARSLVKGILENKINVNELDLFIYATTIVTNLLIERKGARVGFITNKGFKDTIFIKYANREYLYNLDWESPKPLVKRRDCFELSSPIDGGGNDSGDFNKEVEYLAKELKDRKIKTVAVCFLFSYLNPMPEKIVRQRLKKLYPELYISLSHEVHAKWKEVDRASTTIANAYVQPVFADHTRGIMNGLKKIGISCPFFVSKSNGGISRIQVIAEQPTHSIMSGPAAGVLAGVFFGKLLGHDSVLTLDMGGTSCDVSLVQDGNLPYAEEYEVDFGIPVKIPTVAVHTIGAGGGSIGWIDEGRLLHIGPYSAGVDPGPACYDKGGKNPTVTDANLLLGRLNPGYFCGGKIRLNVDAAERAIAKLSNKIGMDIYETAEAMLTIAIHNMVNALSLISTKRGIDPREFTLIAFGGAGGLHAAKIAEVLSIPRVIIPIYPGNTSTLGLFMSNLRVDFAKSILLRSDNPNVLEKVNETLFELRKQAFRDLRKEGVSGEPQIMQAVQLRYYWQNYSRSIVIPPKERLTQEDLNRSYEAFHEDHKDFYGFNMPGHRIEIVEISGTFTIPTEPFKLWKIPIEKRNGKPKEIRSVYINKDIGFVDTPIFRRASMFPGLSIEGPAFVEEAFSTTMILPHQNASIDKYGNICMFLEN